MKYLLTLIILLSTSQAFAQPVVILDGEWMSGSGTVISSDHGVSMVLTARHVCLDNRNPRVMALSRDPQPAIIWSTHLTEDVCLIMTLGNYKATKVAKSFNDNEELAFEHSLYPGPIYNLVLPINLEGRTFHPQFGHFMAFDGLAYPGMSGSSILNSRGQLIGVLIIGSHDSLHGGYVELPYIHQLLNGVDSATINENRFKANSR